MLFFCSVKEYIGAKMSKLPGPSRIPTFGTRIPQIGSALKSNRENEVQISTTDVGKVVSVAGKIGILRFVGKVHFASGVWCGVELETDAGKNDGCIDGKRYFSCSPGRGLMTPVSKVSFAHKSCKFKISQSKSTGSFRSLESEDEISDSQLKIDIELKDLIFNRKSPKSNTKCLIQESNQRPKSQRRELTYEKLEQKEPHCSRNSNRSDVFDKNVDCFNTNEYIPNNNNNNNNNDNRKKSSILSDCERKNSQSLLEGKISQPKFQCYPSASSSLGTSNGNSLLLVETVSASGSTEIETCEELYEKNFCNQMHETFETQNEHTELQTILNQSITSKKSEFESKDIIFNNDCISRVRDKKSSAAENQSLRNFIFNSQEEENKRDSLELDESLEILTASQMNDEFSGADPPAVVPNRDMPKFKNDDLQFPLPSPNFELILQENITLISDTTINLDLTLDTVDKSKNFNFSRLEETPSPEELPLDPIPIVELEPKSETTKSKTNSFITSITSITSLDTGYQGDGEMSRPGSRGPDNSPLTRRPLQRPPPRRTDAMTDSDFFTESDADNHDDNVLRGDRKAQVIDGTLYGVDPQAAADIYVNNKENMDSSGIFTDLETNTRAEEMIIDEKIDISPTDTSSKTLSENSQNNINEVIAKNANNIVESKKKESSNDVSKKRGNQSPLRSNNSSLTSPRHVQSEDSAKKYKTLKRDVQSKVKLLLETNAVKPERKVLKKPAGRWDAVMNKISKCDTNKNNFQDVKSRVNSSTLSLCDLKKVNQTRQVNSQKTPNNKLRRGRTRILTTQNPSKNSNGESVHSSLSDLSSSPPKKITGSVKKRDVQVTQVLTASKLSPKLPQTSIVADGKKRPINNTPSPPNKTTRKCIFPPKEKKLLSNKENGRSTVKGGRTSPVLRNPNLSRAPSKPPPKTAEALAILVQHLVFNVEAFEVPHLRRQLKKFQNETEDIRLAYQKLEQRALEDKKGTIASLEEERIRWREDIANIIESHHSQLTQISNQKKELEDKLLSHYENSKADMRQQYEDKLTALKREFERLQRSHGESLDILREENEAIREDIDAKNEEIQLAKIESLKMRKDFEAKEMFLKEQIQSISRDNQKFKQELCICKEEILKLEGEKIRILEDNKRLLSYGNGKGVGIQEVESLRAVLELKQSEVSELRKSLAETTQKADFLSTCEEKAAVLQARCEDLQLQLQRKNDYEMVLVTENKKLEQSIHEETNQRKNLSLRNEELQWKIKQNRDVVIKALEQTAEEVYNKTGYILSTFLEENISNASLNLSFSNFSPSLSGRSSINPSVNGDESPESPKVKSIIEKSDSVSYVLDLEENPEVVASRLVRNSFRKMNNTKSPCTKRPRMKASTPLSQSPSANSLNEPNKLYSRTRSVSARNDDEEFQDDLNFSDNSSSTSPFHYSNVKLNESPEIPKNDERDSDYSDDHVLDVTLPALPSEISCKRSELQALPSPKHLAGEAMLSESNSEDECTSSSSGQL